MGIINDINDSYMRKVEEEKLISRYYFFLGRKIVTKYNKQSLP